MIAMSVLPRDGPIAVFTVAKTPSPSPSPPLGRGEKKDVPSPPLGRGEKKDVLSPPLGRGKMLLL